MSEEPELKLAALARLKGDQARLEEGLARLSESLGRIEDRFAPLETELDQLHMDTTEAIDRLDAIIGDIGELRPAAGLTRANR